LHELAKQQISAKQAPESYINSSQYKVSQEWSARVRFSSQLAGQILEPNSVFSSAKSTPKTLPHKAYNTLSDIEHNNNGYARTFKGKSLFGIWVPGQTRFPSLPAMQQTHSRRQNSRDTALRR
jgi:hypothetical protein